MTWLRRRLGAQDGFSLVELLVVMAVFGIVAAIATGSVVQSLRVHREQSERVEQLNRTRVALERVTREIRGANPVLTAEANLLELRTQRANQWRTITIRVATRAGEAARLEIRDWADDAPEPPFTALVRNLDSSQPVFRYFDNIENLNADPPVPLSGSFEPGDARVVEVQLRPLIASGPPMEFRDNTGIRNLRDPGEVE
jgi:prepilin-type N-terminal cleavage/methylation domain-containing protein